METFERFIDRVVAESIGDSEWVVYHDPDNKRGKIFVDADSSFEAIEKSYYYLCRLHK